MKFNKINLLLLLIAGLFCLSDIQAQALKAKAEASKVSVNDFKLNSKLMARAMPYRVIMPENYGDPRNKSAVGKPLSYPVVYLLHGLTGHFDNWTDKTKLTKYAENYKYIIVMPEGNNGWYTDSATVPDDKYESYIIQELIPEIDKRFRTIPDRGHRVIAGLSMGGYGSIKFGLKYPEKFVLIGSFSGALGAAGFTEKNTGAIGKTIDTIFGAGDSEIRKSNDVYKLVREMSADNIKQLPFIYLDCGTEDFLYGTNREYAGLLQEKKIAHEYRELPGKHDWAFWDSQIEEFLEMSERFIK